MIRLMYGLSELVGGSNTIDVATLRRIEGVVTIAAEIDMLVCVAVDQQHLAIVEIRQHALAVDAEIEHDQPHQEEDQCR